MCGQHTLFSPCIPDSIAYCVAHSALHKLAVRHVAVVVEVQAVDAQCLVRLQQFTPVYCLPGGFIHLLCTYAAQTILFDRAKFCARLMCCHSQ